MKLKIDIDDKAVEWYLGKANISKAGFKVSVQQAVSALTMIPSYSIIVEEDNGKEKRKK